jgi:hypothetical protein
VSVSPSDARSKISLQRRATADVGRVAGAFGATAGRGTPRTPSLDVIRLGIRSLEKTAAP